jgi:protein-L-isoaspartate(D-aspartate) O-methyltransferase
MRDVAIIGTGEIPVGEHWQVLEVHRRTKDGFERERVSDVRFVPMTGEVRRTLDE